FLLKPLKQFLLQHRPDCIVVDTFHRWAGDIDELKIPRIDDFTGNGCFPGCVIENTRKHVVLESLSSDSEPFVIPGLADRIEIKEIAYGLEASDQSFIWVVGKIINSSKQEETCSEN
ncbi:abscisate beta-glucosyltransferase-like, partial [Trifolium medium]|nr:abscisate beta-glucosyltransferase-like [Trifolium medium]